MNDRGAFCHRTPRPSVSRIGAPRTSIGLIRAIEGGGWGQRDTWLRST
ncbi:hypothetical protein RBWH47_02502 [Rhodopirellula baltica WH47]|uniref:Uncharacterized protein n=1 Tax=Rhodopirellula baltica WH47 TaxID=991778 RepID=F2AS56_RHOBT|nr:hypothetical protein RBWH47_02502 [Rhodopirellula baltica WH47]